MSDLSEDEFEALEDRVDQLASQDPQPQAPTPDPHRRFDPVHNENDFEVLVKQALDGLPGDVLDQLGNVPVVVSDQGAANRAYGEFIGFDKSRGTGLYADFLGGPADEPQILIFRDTLVRDFGNDPEKLRDQVTLVVRHEVAHFLGFDEQAMARLGLQP